MSTLKTVQTKVLEVAFLAIWEIVVNAPVDAGGQQFKHELKI